jgi:UDP-N-acetylglucosamine 4,6-dehydratase
MSKYKILYNDKVILVTGGTGYFGKNFVSYLLNNYSPSKVIIYSRDEQKQYHLQNDYKDHKNFKLLRFFIGDVRDLQRLSLAMKNVDIVIHAAALKHVPATEYNPMECVKTNVLGAQNIIESSFLNNTKKILALSTDKAANPINIYGASKLVSDKLFVAANNMVGKSKTAFSVVRYGNVFGSTGSVLPHFIKILKNNGKFFPITHDEMTRFIISISEGINFVSKSLEEMKGGEIFVPKIPSIKITDLALALSKKLPRKIIGIRAGEKIHEILCPRDDSHLTLEFNDYYIIVPSINFYGNKNNFLKNKKGEIGKKVRDGFQYDSQNNKYFLTVDKIKEMLKKIS